MTSASSTNYEPVYLLLGLIVIIMLRRAYSMVQGAPVRPARLFGFAAFYALLFALTLALAGSVTPWYYYVLDAGILVVAAVLSTSYIRTNVHLEQRPPHGDWYYRLHPWVSIAYLALFVTRIGVSVWVLGPSALDFFAPSSPVALSVTDVILLQVVDALFAISTGILVGRSVGVYLAYERERAKAPAPLPTGSSAPP